MSLNIEKKIEEGITLVLAGRLDTVTSAELEAVLDETLPEAKELTFDLGELEYISSSGLRLFLKAQKTMNGQGSMIVKNVRESVMEVFDITGFADILTIE